jgi:hypothetical protein
MVHFALQDLVDRLTLEEMVPQMAHGGAGNNGTSMDVRQF